MSRRHVAIAMLVGLGELVACAATSASGAGASSDELAERVTLTVGLTQDLDTPNVTAGALVSSFELWVLQYAALTDKAADDFGTIPGLAESWEASDDGLTYTYTLHEGLKWSDGEPLTADDVAFTIDTSRDQQWHNHSSVTGNLEAVVIDERTVKITSSVPDPKLPVMDVFILPQHIWGEFTADDIRTYDALDGVGSGPYTLTEWKAGQSWTMVANPNYWQGEPAIDQIVFRIFTNSDAMVAALEKGEIDAAHQVPESAFESLGATDDIETVFGAQGGFTALSMNGMAGGLGDGHPALLDIDVRHAIHRAIDKDALFDTVILGLSDKGVTMSVSPDPAWQPEIPADEQYTYDPAEANRLLDEGGYIDTDGDGTREMPDGSRDLVLRYAENSNDQRGGDVRELVTGFLADVGIGTEVSEYDGGKLAPVIESGEWDLFVRGWTPYVDPDGQLSYFTCDQLTTDVESPGYNDANWCSDEYDELYLAQNVQLDREKRIEIVHEMLKLFYEESTYIVLFEDADLQAYRTDRFEGWLRQPAGTGPVLFSNSSPTYFNLKPIGEDDGGSEEGTGTGTGSSGDDDDGMGAGVLIAIIVGVAVVAGGAVLAIRSRTNRDERDK